MIGGTDIVIPTAGGDAALDACLRILTLYWPDAVFEDALSGAKVDRYEALPLGRLTEVLVYRSPESAAEWDREGADSALSNTMVHLLLTKHDVTAVVDDPADPAIQPLLASIRSGLRMDILNLSAQERIAA